MRRPAENKAIPAPPVRWVCRCGHANAVKMGHCGGCNLKRQGKSA